jgi:hypothetical protein
MNRVSQAVCKAFLQRSAPEAQERLLSFLPAEELAALKDLPSECYGDPASGISSDAERLKMVHHSWLAPHLRVLSESEVRLFLSSLSETQVKGLKKGLLFSNALPPLNSIALPFLQRSLWEMVAGNEEILPLECLPSSSLNALLAFDAYELLTLIDLLGLHDLALEVKQIIETSKLKKISQALSTQEQAFLKELLHKKEKVAFKRMSLQKWEGDIPSLRSLLHQRGINRLAKALFAQNASFLWYVSHKLDMERGQMLLKLAEPLDHPQAADVLAAQVEEAVASLQSTQAA